MVSAPLLITVGLFRRDPELCRDRGQGLVRGRDHGGLPQSRYSPAVSHRAVAAVHRAVATVHRVVDDPPGRWREGRKR
ncbi:MAG: hypothetical protein HOO00_07550 [Rhodospirillaceae bacterium]|nr:hypothetical protein [Rhodospirillaceae bacterium]MBT5373212.1 hypothetical protein [Rhodospirillaceae bacterium]MBT5658816.1 hypothetical protein [Rhodospirillaceae bacterium]MBT5752343.1 hypothetical protein [Rhodospirillaceae bacterium]